MMRSCSGRYIAPSVIPNVLWKLSILFSDRIKLYIAILVYILSNKILLLRLSALGMEHILMLPSCHLLV